MFFVKKKVKNIRRLTSDSSPNSLLEEVTICAHPLHGNATTRIEVRINTLALIRNTTPSHGALQKKKIGAVACSNSCRAEVKLCFDVITCRRRPCKKKHYISPLHSALGTQALICTKEQTPLTIVDRKTFLERVSDVQLQPKLVWVARIFHINTMNEQITPIMQQK